MDATETALLVALAALGVGVAVGWHMRLSARKTRAAGAAPTAGALALAPSSNRFTRPIESAGGAGCACA